MSARNFMSAREKNTKYDCLPDIKQQKFYRQGSELPPLSANTSASVVNRNITYSYAVQPYMVRFDKPRSGTPFSDFLSESEIDTPDFRSEESDSSSGSALYRSTAEATKSLADEWERIERTLYDEEGEKCTRPNIVEECKQWRALHPQLRVIGKAIKLPDKKPSAQTTELDEIVAMFYQDYEEFSESEERLSQSSTDVTPQNSPRPSLCDTTAEHKVSFEKKEAEPRLTREKISNYKTYNSERDLPESFCSLLHITPVQIRSPLSRKRQNSSILKSELASSRWMKTSRPDSSIHNERNSAKSFVSLDAKAFGSTVLSASERNKYLNSRVTTAKHRDVARLEPLFTPDIMQNDVYRLPNGTAHPYNIRKVSLPPLLLEEEKKKVSINSAKKHSKLRKYSKNSYQLDKVRQNKYNV